MARMFAFKKYLKVFLNTTDAINRTFFFVLIFFRRTFFFLFTHNYIMLGEMVKLSSPNLIFLLLGKKIFYMRQYDDDIPDFLFFCLFNFYLNLMSMFVIRINLVLYYL